MSFVFLSDPRQSLFFFSSCPSILSFSSLPCSSSYLPPPLPRCTVPFWPIAVFFHPLYNLISIYLSLFSSTSSAHSFQPWVHHTLSVLFLFPLSSSFCSRPLSTLFSPQHTPHTQIHTSTILHSTSRHPQCRMAREKEVEGGKNGTLKYLTFFLFLFFSISLKFGVQLL